MIGSPSFGVWFCNNKSKIAGAEYKVKACFQTLLRRYRCFERSSKIACQNPFPFVDNAKV